jgi:hypothetical protein
MFFNFWRAAAQDDAGHYEGGYLLQMARLLRHELFCQAIASGKLPWRLTNSLCTRTAGASVIFSNRNQSLMVRILKSESINILMVVPSARSEINFSKTNFSSGSPDPLGRC